MSPLTPAQRKKLDWLLDFVYTDDPILLRTEMATINAVQNVPDLPHRVRRLKRVYREVKERMTT